MVVYMEPYTLSPIEPLEAASEEPIMVVYVEPLGKLYKARRFCSRKLFEPKASKGTGMPPRGSLV